MNSHKGIFTYQASHEESQTSVLLLFCINYEYDLSIQPSLGAQKNLGKVAFKSYALGV